MTASRQVLRRYRDLPALLGGLRATHRQVRDGEGLLGFALAVRLWERTFWSVSAWVDQEAAETAQRAAGPGRIPAASTTVAWFCLAEELPIGWDEVHHRLRCATGRPRGVVRPGGPVAR